MKLEAINKMNKKEYRKKKKIKVDDVNGKIKISFFHWSKIHDELLDRNSNYILFIYLHVEI